MSKKKQIKAVENSAPVQEDVFIPDDIAPLCGMIITNVTEGKVTKRGFITSKEKLEKLMKLDGVTVEEGEIESMKIRGHEVIAIVSTDRVVTIRKVETNNEETNSNNNPNNKENGNMEKEVKNENVETKVETNNAPAAEAAPAAKPEAPAAVAPEVKSELPAPTPQALADARAMGDALIAARRQIDEEHPYWKEVLKGAGIGAATAVGVIGVIAIYNWITGE